MHCLDKLAPLHNQQDTVIEKDCAWLGDLICVLIKKQDIRPMYHTAGASKMKCADLTAAPETSIACAQAVTRNELYGYLHPATREWKEGLMSVTYRDMANNRTNKHQWIVLDGDIDAEWIEVRSAADQRQLRRCREPGAMVLSATCNTASLYVTCATNRGHQGLFMRWHC